jgi:enamine deaminase RidA (YjgF/YER057c/UK114 family)
VSVVEFFVTPGYGDTLRRDLHYRQAVRVGDRVEISGQGGWDEQFNFPDDLDAEIITAFDNVERTLALAGATWADVIAVDSYHVATTASIVDEHSPVMVDQFRKRMGDRGPIWTQIGVVALGAPKMRVEIRVTAIVGSGT